MLTLGWGCWGAFIVASVIIWLGVFCTLLPVVPGPIIAWIGVLVHRLWLGADESVSWTFLIVGLVLMIVAHPDDEDGALLTYLTRGLCARATLLTLNRGEGGQNAMSADADDALGLIRTNELLKADEYYGVKQLWGTEADFGFSKTQEESFARWSHDRVLYDAVWPCAASGRTSSSPPSLEA